MATRVLLTSVYRSGVDCFRERKRKITRLVKNLLKSPKVIVIRQSAGGDGRANFHKRLDVACRL
jgi:hypothetical protein